MQQKMGIQRTVLMLLGLISLVVCGFIWRMSQPVIMSNEELRINGAVVLDKPRIFSDFELLDHSGEPFNIARMQGIWTIVFFGFTHCPDICPTTLATLNQTYSKLKDSEKERLQIVMISLDPERDTVEKLAEYVPYFNSEFIGVTGNQHLIRRLTAELNIAYNRVPLGPDNYTVDHSTQLVLINPKGHYHGFFKAPHSETMMRSTWRSIDATSGL
ncbi:MAG: SCO family protein [Porticoccaceae bacterium]|nr:SCO family protein [Porticoccaceae bacterium]